MNIIRHIALGSLLLIPAAFAQKVTEETPEDPIQKAIREFNQREKSSSNEVTVVLGAPDEKPDAETPAAEPEPAPVLVTGKPPENTEVIAEETAAAEAEPAAGSEAEAEPAAPPEPRKGLAVRVEKLQSGTGAIDPSQVKLLAPFPAKALSKAPDGWRIEASEHAPAFQREVELAPGRRITLNIRPHLLVPESDDSTILSVSEPGFDPALGYRQNTTVGAVLSRSIRQLDEDSKNLGTAIDNLQQLLVSLPRHEPEPVEEPAAPATNSKPANKR
jgi:hypothetical protein